MLNLIKKYRIFCLCLLLSLAIGIPSMFLFDFPNTMPSIIHLIWLIPGMILVVIGLQSLKNESENPATKNVVGFIVKAYIILGILSTLGLILTVLFQ